MKRTIFLSTPAHYATYDVEHAAFRRTLREVLAQEGHELIEPIVHGDSHIERARNLATHEMLKTDATDLLTFDGDQAPASDDVSFILGMLESGLDVVGAPVPKKVLDWEAIHAAALRGVPADQLELHATSPAVQLQEGPLTWDAGLCAVKVLAIGTGCLLVSRAALEKLMVGYPDDWFISRQAGSDGEPVHEVFKSFTAKVDRKYQSEDYGLCDRWRAIGGDVWMYVGVQQQLGDGRVSFAAAPAIAHYGRQRFVCNHLAWLFERVLSAPQEGT
jgi:hypothetical protein